MNEVSLIYKDLDGVLTVTDAAGVSMAVHPEHIDAAVRRWETWRSSPNRDAAELAALGSALGQALVPHLLQRNLQLSIGSARALGIPFRLFVEGSGEFLAKIPWEALRLSATSPSDPVDGMLALQPDVSLVRRLGQGSETAPVAADEVRILIATADPGSWRYPRLAWLATEVKAIEGACARTYASVVNVKTLFDASSEELRQAISEFRPNVFHFSGHAETNPRGTSLVLQGARAGAADLLDVEKVGEWLASGGCQLAVLSACETDAGSGSAAVTLRRAGLAAVVAMQDVARDASLPSFSRALYGALLDGLAIDRAVTEARLAIVGPANTELLPSLWCDAPFSLFGRQAFSSPGAVPNNLRSLGQEAITIGRSREFAAIVKSLEVSQAVCLVGAGGMGKSHLAGAVARKLLAKHPDGVWFLECDAMDTEEDVWTGLAALVAPESQVGPQKAVLDALQNGRPLVVLDCFERLASRGEIGAIGALRESTQAALVITSRTMVEAEGIERIEVGPLPFGALHEEAESLFVDLMGLADKRLGAQDAKAISEICVALDGVPLALAVAAGRARLVGVSTLRDLLVNSPIRALGGLASPVGVAVERSLSLLPVEERELLWRLSVFAGSFDWASAVEVYPDDRFALLDGVDKLVANSLLRRTGEESHVRFVLLDSVRDYLAAAMRDEVDALDRTMARRRHVDRYLSLALDAAASFREGNWVGGTHIVRAEIANFRAALSFARDHAHHEAVATFARCLCRPLMESGMTTDFGRFAAEGHRAAEAQGDRALPADLLGLEGALASRMGDKALCEDAWTRRAALYREAGDAVGEVDATLDLADEAKGRGEFERALELISVAESLIAGLGRPDLEATAAVIRATVALDRGRPEEARQAASDAEEKGRDAPQRDVMLYVRSQLGYVWHRLDEPLRAEAAFASVIADAMQGDRQSQAAISAIWLSRILEGRGKIEAALMCAVAAEEILTRLGSRRRGEAERRRVEICQGHAGHPCLQRLDRLQTATPADLLGEVLRRSYAADSLSEEPA